MKMFFVLISLIFTVEGVAQRFSDKQLQKLDESNMDLGKIDLSDQNAVSDLEGFLAFDKQYKRKKRSGFIFAGAGAILATTGVLSFTQRDGSVDTYPLEDLAGSASIILGAGCIGAVLPLFSSAKKEKQKRDELLDKFRD